MFASVWSDASFHIKEAILSEKQIIFPSKYPFKILFHFLLRHACLKTTSYILVLINCIQYPYYLDVTA